MTRQGPRNQKIVKYHFRASLGEGVEPDAIIPEMVGLREEDEPSLVERLALARDVPTNRDGSVRDCEGGIKYLHTGR